ncbi:acyl-coa desaturase [Holotrichia oblita]|uniref:Acyl-coa desaturase n=2 Tax=Holotrichia oblita TaxID=644536 RepID=A0ACB9SXS9_HOLOL|nr:hypothetical protein MML48_10g00018271 [Holotrichia oblita]KAI4459387.1 acyl-coa desaturase [Holotrichia oblita]
MLVGPVNVTCPNKTDGMCVTHQLSVRRKKWQSRTPDEKRGVADRKKYIIDRFRKKTGLLLDTPKQGGGNTNDGNSAMSLRCNSKDVAITSEITGVNHRLIERFYVILRTLTSGFEIDVKEFKNCCDETTD